MDPKMTAQDAANFLGISKSEVMKKLESRGLPYCKQKGTVYFGHNTARKLFEIEFEPKVIAFQIVKGGTGKTSLAHEVAVRAHLYGARVLCIDLDQQGNLTQTFSVDADSVPVMVDILAEGYDIRDAIVEVLPGLDVLPSRIENAILDDVIRIKEFELSEVYGSRLQPLKDKYDVIIIDCPPHLGQSVAAVTLAADKVIAPVTPEKFAMSGLQATAFALSDIETSYQTEIPFEIVINKYDARTVLSQQAKKLLDEHKVFYNKLLPTPVRLSQELPNAVAKGGSVFDGVKSNIARKDIDALTCEVMGWKHRPAAAKPKAKPRVKVKANQTVLEEV